MTLVPGAHLGPYEILGPLGEGGMGEVYRARDPRFRREVAVKVLPADFAQDPERLKRFEHEARAAGALNHPNILTVHDLGTADSVPYLVTELLEGETLRERITRGAPPLPKAIEWAAQIARGLAAAHEKGIVHRDLKPENLFVTKDGRVKILDFGLARLERAGAGAPGGGTMTATLTETGMLMGTAGYMAPEQVRGEPADARSDLFAFGCVLYELLAGKRAFAGTTAIETMAAILNAEPEPVDFAKSKAPPMLEALMRHCLEKEPAARFQSTRDLVFALEAVAGIAVPAADGRTAPARRITIPAWAAVLVALLLVGSIVMGLMTASRPAGTQVPSFQRLTYGRGVLGQARFAPDGSTIVYSAAWDGKPEAAYTTRIENPGARALDLGHARILAVSSGGELALSMRPRIPTVFERVGTLARVPLAGGAPREVVENVSWADWSPDGRELAVVRDADGPQLEFPVGHVLYRPRGWISHPRVSPDGKLVAFAEHPNANDDRGAIVVVDRAGHRRAITQDWASLQGLAWSPRGNEVWFTASVSGFARALHAVTLSGRERMVARVASAMTLQDITPAGRVLMIFENFRFDLRGRGPGEHEDRDLAWLDHSYLSDLSADGETLLLSEQAEAAGVVSMVCVRGTDGSAVVPLGHGQGFGLSPDGKWALTHAVTSPQYLLLPTGAGESRVFERDSIDQLFGACWLPDGGSIVFHGREPGRPPRMYVQAIAGGAPLAFTPEGIATGGPIVTPDGRSVWVGESLYHIAGGTPTPAPRLRSDERPLRWSPDGRWLFTARLAAPLSSIMEIRRRDSAGGVDVLVSRIVPADPAGIVTDPIVQVSADGRSYVYMYNRFLSDLYLVDGLK